MAKIDIYHYDVATKVRSVTLSNCDSANVDDYVVIINNEEAPSTSIKPHAISGSTMSISELAADVASDYVDNCLTITVIQQGA
jgi:hypothetical protein